MSGRKRASGVPSTAAHRAGKVKAGRASAAARRAAAQAKPPAVDLDSDGDALYRLPADRPATLADYSKILGRPVSWTDAKKREEVAGEILANEVKADEARIRRGKLFTRDQVAERDRAQDARVLEHLTTIYELLQTVVTPDKRGAAQDAAKAWIADIRTKLAQVSK